jgi:GNAT superfamily N-acetyltransferase
MNTLITYRKGTIEDIPAFIEHFKVSIPLLFPYYSPNSSRFTYEVDYSPEFITKKLKEGDRRVYLALDGNKIVGYIFVMESIAGVSMAEWLGVDKEYQKQGIATQLMSMWEAEALDEGAHSLQLWTTKDCVSFYEKRGMKYGGLFPKAWHGIDCYLIYKTLREPEEKNFLKKFLSSQSSS